MSLPRNAKPRLVLLHRHQVTGWVPLRNTSGQPGFGLRSVDQNAWENPDNGVAPVTLPHCPPRRQANCPVPAHFSELAFTHFHNAPKRPTIARVAFLWLSADHAARLPAGTPRPPCGSPAAPLGATSDPSTLPVIPAGSPGSDGCTPVHRSPHRRNATFRNARSRRIPSGSVRSRSGRSVTVYCTPVFPVAVLC